GLYDCGWIFPGASDGKQRGLTLFKTRFGGEPHRAFRARRQVEPARPSNPEPEPEPAPVGQSADERPTTAQRRLGLVRRLTRRLRFD
ncbi:MAG TPA: hypothetical protein PK812_06830, partial [Beijerinckiaceae bacterium]|nr:hypothetical protein [Beijerinckiaceae bacterium]